MCVKIVWIYFFDPHTSSAKITLTAIYCTAFDGFTTDTIQLPDLYRTGCRHRRLF